MTRTPAQTLDIIVKHLGFSTPLNPSQLPVSWLVDDMHTLELLKQDGEFILSGILAEDLPEDAAELEVALVLSGERLAPGRPVVTFQPEGRRLILWEKIGDAEDDSELLRKLDRFLAELRLWYSRLPLPSASPPSAR